MGYTVLHQRLQNEFHDLHGINFFRNFINHLKLVRETVFLNLYIVLYMADFLPERNDGVTLQIVAEYVGNAVRNFHNIFHVFYFRNSAYGIQGII